MHKISIANNIENLDKIAGFIEQFGEENNLGMKLTFELNLVLDELITNIINYGFTDNKKHIIEITIEIEADTIKMLVIDDGQEFNPLEKQDTDVNVPLQEKAIGGLGIFFVKKKVDQLKYERVENKNYLYLLKKINKD